jgi:hypothetical protein
VGRPPWGQNTGSREEVEDPVLEGTRASLFAWGRFDPSSLMVVAACCDASEAFRKGGSRKGFGVEGALA